MQFLYLVATLCLAPERCMPEKIVTTEATQLECIGSGGLLHVTQWAQENGYTARGYYVGRWGCTRTLRTAT